MAKCSICGKELETRNLGKIHVKQYGCFGKSSENTRALILKDGLGDKGGATS